MHNPEQISGNLIRQIIETQTFELGCEDVARLIDRCVERGDAAGLPPCLEQHLRQCPDCREGFETLLRLVRATPELTLLRSAPTKDPAQAASSDRVFDFREECQGSMSRRRSLAEFVLFLSLSLIFVTLVVARPPFPFYALPLASIALASRPGDVIDYTTPVNLSLGYETAAWEARELIKRHVFALRRKLEPGPAAPRYLLNVRGVGYRLCQPE